MRGILERFDEAWHRKALATKAQPVRGELAGRLRRLSSGQEQLPKELMRCWLQ